MFEDYILNNHKKELIKILQDEDIDKHFSLTINFVKLFEKNTEIGNNILKEPITTLSQFDASIIKTQQVLKQELDETNYEIKNKVHVRISGLPACPELHRTVFPTSHDLGSFLQISGTVVRITASKMLEFQRQYICLKCKHVATVEADYEQRFILYPPKKCPNPGDCDGKNIIPVKTIEHENCKDYQEIKLQEQVNKLGIGSMPTSMWVTLEDDLVDCCKPGDDVTVCGIVMRRWKPQSNGKKLDIELVLRANHVQVNNDQRSIMLVTPEIKSQFNDFWNTYRNKPLVGRDIILKSFCPQLYGMYLAKLAIAIILAGGSRNENISDTGIKIRSEPHLLLVGDPGTGKSQMLRFASKVIPRSVLTTGIGTTSAGLTVTAVMEEGEWQLEAGALVLSDEGICCIDEFSSMKEHDRASIHEAMEQQTISVAKASMVCKLSTRCSVLAATNPKGNLDANQPLSLNTAIASPLLSRFDLILLLRDTLDNKWDEYVCDHIFKQQIADYDINDCAPWSVELLQAYYIIIKSLHPVLTEDANLILSSYYKAQRQAPTRNVARTTVRLLDSLVRLSQAHARLMYRTEVQIMDAVMAIALIESSMQGAALLLPTDIDTLHAPFPENSTQSYIQLLTTVLNKLNLTDLLNKELSKINTNSTDDTNENIEPNNSRINRHKPTLNNLKRKTKINKIIESTDKNTTNTIVDTSLSQIKHTISVVNKTDSTNIDNSKLNKNILIDTHKTNKFEETTSNNKRKIEINNKQEKKKSKVTNKKSGKMNDLQLINMIPSVNDIFNLNEVDDDILDLNFSEMESDLNTSKTERIQHSTKERKEIFTEKMNTLKNNFAFQPKNKTPVKPTVISEEQNNKNILNDNESITEKHDVTLVNKPVENKSNKILEAFAFKPRKTTPTKIDLNEDKMENEENSSLNVQNNDSESNSQSSQLSAKTLFQNDEDIDDLDLDL